MVNRSLVVRKPSENASIAKMQPWVGQGLRMVGEGMSRTVIVAQCPDGAGCMKAVINYEGNQVEPDLEGVTVGHSMESLSVSASGLATHGIYGDAIIWSRWYRVGEMPFTAVSQSFHCRFTAVSLRLHRGLRRPAGRCPAVLRVLSAVRGVLHRLEPRGQPNRAARHR